MIVFEHICKSESTLIDYRGHMSRFLKFSKIKDYDSLVQLDRKQLQIILEDYLFHCKKQYATNSIKKIFSCITCFFKINDVELNFYKIKKMYPHAEKLFTDKAYTTDQVRTIIDNTQSLELKSMFHLMACSGVRVGSLNEFKIKHLEDMPNGCKSILVYADSSSEYTTFITSECYQVLQNYLNWRKRKGEIITDDSYLFVNDYGNQHNSRTIAGKINSMVKRTIERINKKGRYEIMSSHGLRKRFNTILKMNNSINPNIAERLLGHSRSIQLDNSYFRPTKDQLFTEYQKAIPGLLIDEKYRLEFELENQKAENEKLESDKDKRIENLENKLEVLNEFVRSLSKSHHL